VLTSEKLMEWEFKNESSTSWFQTEEGAEAHATQWTRDAHEQQWPKKSGLSCNQWEHMTTPTNMVGIDVEWEGDNIFQNPKP